MCANSAARGAARRKAASASAQPTGNRGPGDEGHATLNADQSSIAYVDADKLQDVVRVFVAGDAAALL